MSLYDDEDLPSISSTAAAPGWSQGVKLLQTQMQLKKATNVSSVRKPDSSGPVSANPAVTPGRHKQSLAPVKDFKKTKKDSSSDESKLSFTPSVS